MSLLNPTNQVERLRALVHGVETLNIAVQSMPPPSYIGALLTDDVLTRDVILVYRINSKRSAESLPISVELEDENSSTDLDVTGNPLESPFCDQVFDDTIVSIEQSTWIKAELNQFPVPIQNARTLINSWNEAFPLKDKDEDGMPLLDIWILTDDGTKQNSNISNGKSHAVDGLLLDVSNLDSSILIDSEKKTVRPSKVMLGRHCVDKWYSRSIVTAKGSCSMNSPEMNTNNLRESHLTSSKLPASKVTAHVLCRHIVSGHPVPSDPAINLSSLLCYACVTLELQWNKLTMSPPLEIATTNMISQVGVGHPSSPAYLLWKQLCLLQKLLSVLLASWCSKKTPTALPGADEEVGQEEDSPENASESLESKLESVIREGRGGALAFLAQSGAVRNSLPPSSEQQSRGLGRYSFAPGFVGRMSLAPTNNIEGDFQERHLSLLEAVNIVSGGARENLDLTDELWSILSKCKSYEELSRAWTLVFSELSQGHSRPYIRPKNHTRAAKLLQALVSGQHERGPDFYKVEGSGIFEPLELLVELGLEKLATDFYYIFLDSETVSKDCFVAPELLRNDITVSRDMWLKSCGHFLGWLAQVHAALEVTLPIFKTLCPEKAVASISASALKYFQSETSPVRSVSGLMKSFWQEFQCVVNTRDVHGLLTDKFDWLKLTLTSENKRRRVKSVFLRSRLGPLFPPQLFSSEKIFSDDAENNMYYCAESHQISDYLG